MAREKNTVSGNTTMLILKLLEEKDRYGYELIEELATQSERLFELKTGTLYPILHQLEREGMLSSYEQEAEGNRTRRYYRISKQGRKLLKAQQEEWQRYVKGVNRILEGGLSYG